MAAESGLVQDGKRRVEVSKIQMQTTIEELHRRNCCLFFLHPMPSCDLVLTRNRYIRDVPPQEGVRQVTTYYRSFNRKLPNDLLWRCYVRAWQVYVPLF